MNEHEWERRTGPRENVGTFWKCLRCGCSVLWSVPGPPPVSHRAQYFGPGDMDLEMDCDERIAFNVLGS